MLPYRRKYRTQPDEHFDGNAKARGAAHGGVIVTLTPPAPSPTTAENPPAQPAELAQVGPSHWQGLKNNLANAVKLALLLRVAAERLTISWWQTAAFAIIGLLPPLIYDLAATGLSGAVAWQNFPDALAHLPVLLFAAIAGAYALGREEHTPTLLQALLMIVAMVDIVSYLVYTLPPPAWLQRRLELSSSDVFTAGLIWLGAASAKFIDEHFTLPRRRRLLATMICVLLALYPLAAMERDRSLWHRALSAEELAEGHRAGLGEDHLYNQRELLERELAAVQPGRPGIAEIYFVGMAGDGQQNVFMKEVNAVSQLFRERFGAAGRVVRLINNRREQGKAPIASVTSLAAALNRVGQVMNRDEDILFLFLTSHGSKDHRFALDLWPVEFHQLGPQRLRQLLDASGIKQRVIVVSACYSGGFIEALKNDDTLAITASAPDKNSFGCSNEAEWTYFGKAYFDEALRQTFSFVEAFELAKPAIAQREQAEEFDPSEPQFALGSAIAPKLAQLAKRLAEAKP